MSCPECERLSKVYREARLEYESAKLVSVRHHSSFPPTPTEAEKRERDSELVRQANLNLIQIEEDFHAHQMSHRKVSGI
jgi:hypothetical protein